MYNIEGVTYKSNQKLKKYNTFRVNAIAKHFFIPETINGLKKLLSVLKEEGLDFILLGGGSNILFVHEIVERPIVYTGYFSRTTSKTDGIIAYSGASIKELLKAAKSNEFTGLEFLSGLPGTVGGATYMNARCYEHSISEFIDSVGVIDEEGEYTHLKREELDYSYKNSVFQKRKLFIVDIIFKLSLGKKREIVREMKKYYKDRKNKKQFKYPSAGSVFLNDYNNNMVAGKVIEECGLKGLSIGGASVSDFHANFIINKKNAKGNDILKLIREVQRIVENKKNIKLNTEVRIIE